MDQTRASLLPFSVFARARVRMRHVKCANFFFSDRCLDFARAKKITHEISEGGEGAKGVAWGVDGKEAALVGLDVCFTLLVNFFFLPLK